VVRGGGCQTEQGANACQRLADRETDDESKNGQGDARHNRAPYDDVDVHDREVSKQ
jgi:hypothetical protein